MGKAPSDEEIAAKVKGHPQWTLDELKKAVEEAPILEQAELQEAVDLLGNGKAYMPLGEFEALIGGMGEPISAELMAKVKRDAEPDTDQQVNLRHFVAKMMTRP